MRRMRTAFAVLGLARVLVLPVLVLPVLVLPVLPAHAQDETVETAEPKPTLAITAIAVEPEGPAVDTLCRVRVTVRNTGPATVSALYFRVAVNGADLEVYENQVFMDRLDAGAETEVVLYNFWTTESRRPAPADGKLQLVVELREAQLVEITTEDDGTEVWTLGDAVAGLPVSKELGIKLKG